MIAIKFLAASGVLQKLKCQAEFLLEALSVARPQLRVSDQNNFKEPRKLVLGWQRTFASGGDVILTGDGGNGAGDLLPSNDRNASSSAFRAAFSRSIVRSCFSTSFIIATRVWLQTFRRSPSASALRPG